MMKLGTIYQAINKINGKSYIGQTFQNFKWYKQKHINTALNGSDKYFYRAIRKYGKDNFTWKILFQDYCYKNKLSNLEIFYIAYYNTLALNGYNMTPGGEGGWFHNHPNKKEIYKEIGRKTSNTLKQINPKTGLTGYQENALKAAKIKHEINPKTGLSKNQEKGMKVSKTLNKINSKTGLTIAQERGLKNGKILKERGSNAGKNNPMYETHRTGSEHPSAKKYLLIAPNGQLIGAYGNLGKKCKKYNLSCSRLLSFINKGKISDYIYKTHKNNQDVINTIDWEIYTIS